MIARSRNKDMGEEQKSEEVKGEPYKLKQEIVSRKLKTVNEKCISSR
jgi:hypothetical protein